MQAIILAAGFGSRLRPLTESMPKCLTEVNGTPLLVNTLTILEKRGIKETIIVLGHMHEKIMETIGFQWKSMKITYVENTIYKDTNNVYSLYLTKNYIHDDVLMLECDLYFNEYLIDILCQSDADCNILVSPFNQETMDGTVVSVDSDLNVRELIIGKKQGADFDYSNKLKTVNIYKFKKEFMINQYMSAIELYVSTQQKKSYYELVLGSLILFGNAEFKAISVDENMWAEIDDIDDLHRAEIKFSDSNLL